jgi:hypothetical protein
VKTSKQPLIRINEAISQLGRPDEVWFRGHTETHKLLPWLFRFPGGLENEQRLFKRFLHSRCLDESLYSLSELVAMQNSYFPTRLIAWTRNLHIALFCALAREEGRPSIFVLDPLKLNRRSSLQSIPTADQFQKCADFFSDGPKNMSESPIAISCRDDTPKSNSDALFTIHGRDKRPLEQQCSECVRKVVLTSDEKLLTSEYILSGDFGWAANDLPWKPGV